MDSFRKILLQTALLGTLLSMGMVVGGTVFAAAAGGGDEGGDHAISMEKTPCMTSSCRTMMCCSSSSKMGGYHSHTCHHRHGSGLGGPGEDFSKNIEGRIAFLKAELGITDSQTFLWNDFADALRSLARRITADTDTKDGDQSVAATHSVTVLSLSEALRRREKMLTARLATIQALREEYMKLSEQLTPQQLAIADALIGPYVHRL